MPEDIQAQVYFSCKHIPAFENMTTPMVVTATAEREAGAPVGLTLKSSEKYGKLLVETIALNGPFFGSPLRVDMLLRSINNVDCANLSVAQATKLLERESFVTVLAQEAAPLPEGSMITATLVKPSADSKIGLRMTNYKGREGLFISGVSDGTLASVSQLRPGLCVAKINNVDCTSKTTAEASKIMVEADGPVTILAYTPLSGTAPSLGVSKYMTATVQTGPFGENMGLDLHQPEEESKVLIKRVDPEGPFFSTPLRAGMEIVQVNGTSCTSREHASELLQEGGEYVTILAFKPSPRYTGGQLLSVVLQKETRDTKIGLRFGFDMGKDTCAVTFVKDGSPASTTELEVGYYVHSVNNTLCSCLSPPEITKLLAEAEGTITILAEVPNGTDAPTADAVSFVTATMLKEGSEGKVGLSLGRRGDDIVITRIADDSLAASTDLQVGLQLVSINNVILGNELEKAVALLKESNGPVMVVAKRMPLPAGSLITAAMKRESADQKWGVKLSFVGDKVVIGGIYADSPAAATDLERGFLVKSINNVDVRTLQPKDVGAIFAADTKTMTLLVETSRETNMVCTSHAMSVRSVRGLVPKAVEPEVVATAEEEIDVTPEARDEHEVDVDELEELHRLRKENEKLKAKMQAAASDKPAEVKKAAAPVEVKKPAAPVEVKKPAAPVEVKKPAAPVEVEKPVQAATPVLSRKPLDPAPTYPFSDDSSDEESLPSAHPEVKVSRATEVVTWFANGLTQTGIVTDVVDC